jgi:hypothetical protein
MMLSVRLHSAWGVSPALLFLGSSLSFAQNLGPSETDGIARAAAVLARQFETVSYAKADFLSSTGAYRGMDARTADTVRFPFAELLGGLKFSGAHDPNEIFKNTDSVLAGAKEFRPPAGLGGVHSKDCYILILNRSNDQTRQTERRGDLKDDNGEEFRQAILQGYFAQTPLES